LQEKLAVKIVDKIPKTPYLPKYSCCKTGTLKTIEVFDKRGPPTFYLGARQNIVSCKF
jgi:hypothetical protein